MKVTISKIERVMDRADVEYEVAKEALEAANGNLIDAIIALERDGKFGPNAGQGKTGAYSTAGASPNVIGESYGTTVPQTRVEPNFTLGQGAQGKAGKQAKAGKAGKAGKTGKANQAGPRSDYRQENGQQGGFQQGNYQQGNGQQGGYQQGGYQGGYQQGNYQQGGYQQSGYWQGAGGCGRGGRGGPHRYKDESTAFEDSVRRFARWIGRLVQAGLVNQFEIWRRGGRVMYFPVILFLFCLIPWVFWLALILLLIGLFCGCSYRFAGPNLGKKSVNDAMDRASKMAEEFKNGDDPDR